MSNSSTELQTAIDELNAARGFITTLFLFGGTVIGADFMGEAESNAAKAGGMYIHIPGNGAYAIQPKPVPASESPATMKAAESFIETLIMTGGTAIKTEVALPEWLTIGGHGTRRIRFPSGGDYAIRPKPRPVS